MRIIIINALNLVFGQIHNVLYRQQDFTTDNTINLLITIREIFVQVHEINKNQIENAQMSTKEFLFTFVGILLHYFLRFLKGTAFGRWITNLSWKNLTFTKKRLFNGLTLCLTFYFVWKHYQKLDITSKKPVQLFLMTSL